MITIIKYSVGANKYNTTNVGGINNIGNNHS
jgi:hypothetical protein